MKAWDEAPEEPGVNFDRELASLLDVDPSPGFKARLRAQTLQASAPGERRLWALAAVGTGAVALLAAAFVGLHEPVSVPSRPSRAPVPVQQQAAQAVPSVPTERAPAISPRVNREAAVRTLPSATRPRRPIVPQRQEPAVEVIISPDEAAGLELLRVQTARAGCCVISAAEVAERPPGQPMEAIVISRIEIPPLDPAMAFDGVRQ